MLAKIIAPMGQRAQRFIGKFIAGLEFIFAGMAFGAEIFLMAGAAGLTGSSGVEPMFGHKIGGPVIQCSPRVGVALGTVRDCVADTLWMNPRNTAGVGTGVKHRHQQKNRKYYQFISHSLSPPQQHALCQRCRSP